MDLKVTDDQLKSKIYEAFVSAANEVARKEIQRIFDSDDNIKKEIIKIVQEAFLKAFEGQAREKIVNAMSSGLYDAFTK